MLSSPQDLTNSSKNTTNIAKASDLPFVINDYTFTTMIGKGGFAEVYLVTHAQYPNKKFVAKVMSIDASEMEQKWEIFDGEVQSLLLLDHPHIIRLYDYFKVSNQFYLILEYCPNGSLHDEIISSNGLSMDRFIKISTEVVDALAYCHSHNIAHRDIKPENILLDENCRSRVADFGFSIRTEDGELLRNFSGSFLYTAPEIFQKKAHDPKAGDIWALGVSFTVMVTGSSPWQSDSMGGIKQLAAAGVLNFKKKIPEQLETIIRKMLVVEPSQRITMQQLRKEPFFNQPMLYRNIPLTTHSDMLHWGTIPRFVEIPDVDFLSKEFELNDNNMTLSETKIHSASQILMQPFKKPRILRRKKIKEPVETFMGFEDEITEIKS